MGDWQDGRFFGSDRRPVGSTDVRKLCGHCPDCHCFVSKGDSVGDCPCLHDGHSRFEFAGGDHAEAGNEASVDCPLFWDYVFGDYADRLPF